MFAVLARIAGRPRTTLLVVLVFVVGLVILGSGVSSRLQAGGSADPGSDSARAAQVMNERFPASQPNLVLLVRPVSPGATVDEPEVSAAGNRLGSELAHEPGVIGVVSYWQNHAAGLRSSAGDYALVTAHLSGSQTVANQTLTRIVPAFQGSHGAVSVQLGGLLAVQHQIRSTISADLSRAEVIVLPITLVILVLVFGSVVAALLPLGVGILAILGTRAVLRGLTSVTSVSVFSQNLTTALGLGLAIDYALFIVRRFREEQSHGLSPQAAVTVTLQTAGRTVLFSALTVAVSLAVMLLFPMYFLRSFAYAGVSVVFFAAVSSLVVIPALLVLLGPRVDALSLRRLMRRPIATEGGIGWRRLVAGVMRAPIPVAVLTVAALVALGLPFSGIRFGTADYRQLPVTAQPRAVQDLLRSKFSADPTSRITILVEGSGLAGRVPQVAAYAQQLSSLSDVREVSSSAGSFASGQQVSPPSPADAARVSGDVGYLTLLLGVDDISPRSESLTRQIRALHTPFRTLVTGDPATVVDTNHAIGSRLALALGIIALAMLFLIFLFTGSIVAPLLALAVSALSLTAMFGAVVWVFQRGHGSGLLNFTPTGFVDVTLPVLMFCVAFGLSMDYSVFVLSRIKEEYDRTGDHRGALLFGMQHTGGIITAAAAILAIVLGVIGSSRITNIKMLGLGVALAVLVDATVVRCLLVPALMTLFGRATWWAPRPLAAFQRRFGIAEAGSDVVQPKVDRAPPLPDPAVSGVSAGNGQP
jgi:RND superfamily putative drug exporter